MRGSFQYYYSSQAVSREGEEGPDATDCGTVLKNWYYYEKNPDKLREIILRSPPDSISRPNLWLKMTKTTEVQEQFSSLYSKLKDPLCISGYEDLIKKDLHRTFPKDDFFKESGGPGQTALFNVLKAYSNSNAKLGYVQGMGYIAGFILKYLKEEEAFWMFWQLMNNKKYSLKDFFRRNLEGFHFYTFIVTRFLEESVPSIVKHFNDSHLEIDFYTTPFALSLCSSMFEDSTTERIWDLFLLDGWKLLARVPVGILKLFQREILSEPATDSVPKLMSSLLKIEPNEVLKAALSVKISSKNIQKYLQQYEDQLSRSVQQRVLKHRKVRTEYHRKRFKTAFSYSMSIDTPISS